MTSTWQSPKEENRNSPRSQQIRRRTGQQIDGNEEYDYAIDPKNRLEVLQRVAEKLANSFVIVINVGPKSIGRRAFGILSILQALTTDEFFLRVGAGFGCLEKKTQPTDGGCEQHPQIQHVQSFAQHDHISSREHAWLKLRSSGLHIFVSLKQLSSTCHVSFICRT